MRSFTVKARSLESAQALVAALSEFSPEFTGNEEEGYSVHFDLGGSDSRIIAVLNALEEHVQQRHTPARVELDGRTYVVSPD